MKYRIKTYYNDKNPKNPDKEVTWDIDEVDQKYPNLSEINKAASKEFPEIPAEKLVIVPNQNYEDDGEGILLTTTKLAYT